MYIYLSIYIYIHTYIHTCRLEAPEDFGPGAVSPVGLDDLTEGLGHVAHALYICVDM